MAIPSLWLGAVVTRSPVLLEIASVSSLLLLCLAIPLCFYDNVNRRPFWAGFAAIGLGLMLAVTFFDVPLNETSNAITGFAMSLSGTSDIPHPTTTEVVPFVSYAPDTTKTSIHDAISRTVQFLLLLTLAMVGGLFVQYSAIKREA